MVKFWLEANNGVVELIHSKNEAAALLVAREIYNNVPDDECPAQWLMKRDPSEDEDDVLVPGGPEGEEFTWMPRSMWSDGGPINQAIKNGEFDQ